MVRLLGPIIQWLLLVPRSGSFCDFGFFESSLPVYHSPGLPLRSQIWPILTNCFLFRYVHLFDVDDSNLRVARAIDLVLDD